MAKPLNKIYTAATTGLIVALSGCAKQPDVYFSCTGGENGIPTRAAYVFADDSNGTIHTKAAQMQKGQAGSSRKLSHSGTNYVSEEVARVDVTFDPEEKDSGTLAKSLAAAAASSFCDNAQTGGFRLLESLEKQKRASEQNKIQANNTDTVPSFVRNLGDPVI